jgi:hypothetical protein
MEISEMLAKVLSQENLNVVKQPVSTASFDLVNRTLTLPMWQGLEQCVETMLVCHEVGHALFTPQGYVDAVRADPQIASVLNVVEDARIERLFKEKYQGSRKDFVAAYKNLRDTDFFDLKDRNINNFNLSDRINLYFKLGVLSGVKFTLQEKEFVDRANKIVTFPETLKLAQDILAFMKEQKEQRKSMAEDDLVFSDELGDGTEDNIDFDDEYDEFDFDFEQDDDNKKTKSTKYGKKQDQNDDNYVDPELESETDKTLNRKLSSFASGNSNVTYVSIDEEYPLDQTIVGYKQILDKISTRYSVNKIKSDSYKRKVMPQVQHIVSVFELKKAAATYALRSIRKTGVLDVNKVAQYKVKEDLFLRNTKVPEGKNHGMIMLLDWSGSMSSNNVIYHSLEQVTQLAMFCRQVGVPYRVFAFSSGNENVKDFETRDRMSRNVNNHNGLFSLLELFSSEMSIADHNKMISFIVSRALNHTYSLTSTPLAPAIMYMRKYIPEFKEQYKVDKLNLITFTDGENTSVLCPEICNWYRSSTVYIKDEVTKRNYLVAHKEHDRDVATSNEVNACYNIIKDRFNCTITSYYVTTGSMSAGKLRETGVTDNPIKVMVDKTDEYKKNGFACIQGYGRTVIYFINSSILKTVSFDLNAIDATMTPAKIATAIKRGGTGGLKNKILIEKFVETIS